MIYDPKLRALLLEKGLTNQQVNSPTAEKMVEIFGDGESNNAFSLLFDEFKAKTIELEEQRKDLEEKIFRTKVDTEKALKKQYENFKDLWSSLSSIAEAIDEYGPITDEKAKNVLTLMAAITRIGKDLGCDANKCMESASYIVYAYLGGQAARNINVSGSNKNVGDESREKILGRL